MPKGEKTAMKFYSNKKYNTVAVYAIIVIAVSMLMVVAIFKFSAISKIIGDIMSILMPVFIGIAIAFLLNPLLNATEKALRKYIITKKPKPKLVRGISVTITSLFFVAVVGGLLYVVIPAFAESISSMIGNVSDVYNKLYDWSAKLLSDHPKVEEFVNGKIESFSSNFNSLLEVMNNVLSGAWSFVNFIKDFVLGFIVSIYILISKETLQAQFKKLFVATFKRSTCQKVFKVASMSNKTFGNFLTGKLIDSLIIGIMCFFGCWILRIPYYVLISVIVGITNIIPYFGPFIGAIPSAAMVLFVEPKKCIVFVIFIFILQQFDGNILGPKILGGTMGMPTFWVLVALFVGGGLFKIVGLLLAVPFCSVVYDLLKEHSENKLRQKNMPTDTKDYTVSADKIFHTDGRSPEITEEILKSMVIPAAEDVNEVNIND